MKIENLKLKISVSGFTLIELLIVIAIIGILSAMLLTNFVGIRQRARDSQRKSDLRQIQSALELYRTDRGVYPTISGTSASNLGACSDGSFGYPTPSCTTIYMKNIPSDPLGLSQGYAYTLTSTGYTLVACLENLNDGQKDATNVSPCDGSTRTSYTLTNP